MTARFLGLLCLAVLTACSSSGGSKPSEPPQEQAPAPADPRKIARAHVELGAAYLQSGRFATAVEEARIAIAVDPKYPEAHFLLGQVNMFLGEAETARKSFETALQLAPNEPEFNNTYGWFLCTQGREREGLEHLSKAATNPFYTAPVRPYTNAGLCYLRLKDDDKAAAQFQRARTLDPSSPVPLFHLADIAYRRGDYSRAREMVTVLNQVSDPTAESLWLGLRVERRLGNNEAEATYSAQLKRKFPESQQYQDFVAGRFE